jgi:hypothetical protein
MCVIAHCSRSDLGAGLTTDAFLQTVPGKAFERYRDRRSILIRCGGKPREDGQQEAVVIRTPTLGGFDVPVKQSSELCKAWMKELVIEVHCICEKCVSEYPSISLSCFVLETPHSLLVCH